MTIKRKSTLCRVYETCHLGMIVGVVALVILGISLYSETVRLKDELAKTRQEVNILRSAVATSKNDLYKLTDFQDLEAVVAKLGLVKERNPAYMELAEIDQITLSHNPTGEARR